ncbi:MAG: NAD-dependent epimerase/dehydratase family protein [Chloroflexi bacterium]|nr:NAD-dependent epimerase/dehydratase family protein [Chloroflexota bacterium]
MILVTGGTGFIGSRVVEKLIQSGEPIRLLVRPNRKTPRLPKNIPLNIAVSHLNDDRGVRTALRGVDTIFHFATAEHQGPNADLEMVDVEGTRCLLDAAHETGVKQILFLGRIGADKSSSYPVLKAKSLAEDAIRKRNIPFCVLRLTDVFGANDHFTHEIAAGLRRAPLFYPLPGAGNILVQPIWIEDLLSILMLIYEQKRFKNEVVEVGGGEFFEFHQVVRTVMYEIGERKYLFSMAPAYLRIINLWLRKPGAVFPISTSWLDLLAIDRTCPLDSMTRNFSILPARFVNHLGYLQNKS